MEKKILYFSNKQKNLMLKELIDEILSTSIHPQDYYEIAALIEALGWDDNRVEKIFGLKDIFELAILIWDMVKEKIVVNHFVEKEQIAIYKKIVVILQSFIRGLIFALPMAISVAAMLTLRLSLWSYEYLDVEHATSIALGTILSFITVGGFTQVIARRGFFYISQGFYNMTKRMTFYLIRLGYITCIFVAVFYLIYNFYYKNFPYYMFMISILYYIFLCSNWLSITVMYMLKREFEFALLITFGIFIVALLFYVFRINIILAQITALLIVSFLGLILVIYFFKELEKKEEKGIASPIPKKSILLYTLKPYFIYGFLYFTFIYVDRIMAWSTNNEYVMPYIIWFRGEYELGLDFALLMLILPMGLCEVVVSKLMKELELTQRNSMHHEIDKLGKKYISYYKKSMLIVTFGSVISALLVIILVSVLRNGKFENLSKVYYFSDITNFVFYWALIAYSFISLSLTNVVILFSLSQPIMVTKPLVIALVINFFIGFMFSRWFEYYFAVFGLFIGAIVFFTLSTRNLFKVLKKLDYYIYATS
jgi:hypothetical protein